MVGLNDSLTYIKDVITFLANDGIFCDRGFFSSGIL